MLRNGNKYLLMLVSIIMLTACISQSRTSFIPPQDRESLLAEQPWPHNGFVAISWHNVEDEAADQRFMSVRTSALREQFAWLRENGYQPVSIAQIREAHQGGKPLPEKAVVLTLCPSCGLLAASISGSIVNATGRGEKTHQLPS